MSKITVLIPAYNEAERVGQTVAALIGLPEVNQVIVVDDGSQDATAAVARDAGAQVLILERNMGKGEALSRAAELIDSEVVAMVDADLGATAGLLPSLAAPVLTGTSDMAIARFVGTASGGGFGLVRNLAIWGIYRATRVKVAAPLSGQRVLTKGLWQAVLPLGSGFGLEVGLTIDALRQGFHLVEVPLPMRHRFTRNDLKGILHRGRQFWDVLRVLWPRVVVRQ